VSERGAYARDQADKRPTSRSLDSVLDERISQDLKWGEPIIMITPEGRIFWKGREVESDDDFRAAMLDLAKKLGNL